MDRQSFIKITKELVSKRYKHLKNGEELIQEQLITYFGENPESKWDKYINECISNNDLKELSDKEIVQTADKIASDFANGYIIE